MHYAAGKGTGVIAMEPLRGGKLAKDLPEDVLRAFIVANVRKNAPSR